MYYYAKGCEPIESKRPYYIWMIGNKELLGKLNKKVALTTIQHGYDNYVAFASTTNVPFDIATSLKKHLIRVILMPKVSMSLNLWLICQKLFKKKLH